MPRTRRAQVEHVIHPREASPQPVASVSVEVWKQRAQKRQNLIKAMASSQHLSVGSGSGFGSVRSSGGLATPPEMERPLPYVKDVLAKQVRCCCRRRCLL